MASNEHKQEVEISKDMLGMSKQSPTIMYEVSLLEIVFLEKLREMDFGELTVFKMNGEPRRIVLSSSHVLDDRMLSEIIKNKPELQKMLKIISFKKDK